ncbi:hypothetical protein [Bradyrhizobium sp.]|uniref:hypothetical protein n=1 Tax=Bradyrhizobium sp. TaxID=376 RepID=UPI0025BFF95B|nr:hypothetical protein [Bradyrhizobium sp.]MBV8920996.1 hypothetical protein [Bradyrhizobium sp.]
MADISAPLQVPDQKVQSRAAAPSGGTEWTRAGAFFDRLNRILSYARGLPVITLIGSLLVGYFQYLSAYQEKVSAQAKEDMSAATSTFSSIADAFSEAQMLQQILYFDYTAALAIDADGDAQAIQTKNAQASYAPYEHARIVLRQNGDLFARKAEIYIDWASDFGRDPADTKTPTTDPLNESLLGVYNFDCDDTANIPHFNMLDDNGHRLPLAPDPPPCRYDRSEVISDPPGSYVRLCARENGKILADKPALTLHWYSAKHQLLAMHYCFERLHGQLLPARQWASQSSMSPEQKAKFIAKEADTYNGLTSQAVRLDAFMSLAMFQMENIHVKYRPVGFVCHIPFVTPFVDLFSNYCTPVRTAPVRRADGTTELRQSS